MKNETRNIALSIQVPGDSRHTTVNTQLETTISDPVDGVLTVNGTWVPGKELSIVEDIINNGIMTANEVINGLVEQQNGIAGGCFDVDGDIHTTKLNTVIGRTKVVITHTRSGEIAAIYTPNYEVADTLISAWGDMAADNFYGDVEDVK